MRYNRNTSRFVLTVVVDEHGKAAGVVGAFLGAGEHQVNVGVAVRDEALHTVLLCGRGKCPPRSSPGQVFRYPHCGCSDSAPQNPCKASAAAMLAWLWPSRRGFCNARAINSILSFSEPLNSSVLNRACCRRKSFRILRKDCFQVSGSKVPLCK